MFAHQKTIGVLNMNCIKRDIGSDRRVFKNGTSLPIANIKRGINKKMMDLLWQEKKTDIKNKFDLERSR